MNKAAAHEWEINSLSIKEGKLLINWECNSRIDHENIAYTTAKYGTAIIQNYEKKLLELLKNDIEIAEVEKETEELLNSQIGVR